MANVELVSGWRDFGVCAHQGEIDGGGLEGLEVADREPPRDLLLQHRLLLRVLHSVAVLHVGVLAVVRVALISIILIRGVLEQGDLLVVVRHDVIVLGGGRRLALQPLEEPAQRTRPSARSPTARMRRDLFCRATARGQGRALAHAAASEIPGSSDTTVCRIVREAIRPRALSLSPCLGSPCLERLC